MKWTKIANTWPTLGVFVASSLLRDHVGQVKREACSIGPRVRQKTSTRCVHAWFGAPDLGYLGEGYRLNQTWRFQQMKKMIINVFGQKRFRLRQPIAVWPPIYLVGPARPYPVGGIALPSDFAWRCSCGIALALHSLPLTRCQCMSRAFKVFILEWLIWSLRITTLAS